MVAVLAMGRAMEPIQGLLATLVVAAGNLAAPPHPIRHGRDGPGHDAERECRSTPAAYPDAYGSKPAHDPNKVGFVRDSSTSAAGPEALGNHHAVIGSPDKLGDEDRLANRTLIPQRPIQLAPSRLNRPTRRVQRVAHTMPGIVELPAGPLARAFLLASRQAHQRQRAGSDQQRNTHLNLLCGEASRNNTNRQRFPRRDNLCVRTP